MKLRFAFFAVALTLLSSCTGKEGANDPVQTAVEPADPSPETFAIGSALTARGAVSEASSAEAYRRGPEVFLSVDVSGARRDQLIEVEWRDERGTLIRTDIRRIEPGSRYASFSSGPTAAWKVGPHRASIVIDGRRVSEKSFALL